MSNPTDNTNETRLRAAGIRMALKLIPQDMMDSVPATIEAYLAAQLAEVEPIEGESGACYLIAPAEAKGRLSLKLVALDGQCAVCRIIKESTVTELFKKVIAEIKQI